MSEVESKRIDDAFLRKVIWWLIALNVGQLLGGSVAFGMYGRQVIDNTEFRLSVGGVEKIAISVSKELEKNYMTRPAVEKVIRDARVEMIADQKRLIEPINRQLNDLQQDVKFLVRREITKGDKK